MRPLALAFSWCRPQVLVALAAVSLMSGMPAVNAADSGFPFDHELRLDTAPKRGSKRIPVIQVQANGAMDIDLWCVSGKGTAVLADSTIAIVPTSMRDNQCSADQLAQDESLLGDLTEMTSWKREGEVVVLTGSKTLRFRVSTN